MNQAGALPRTLHPFTAGCTRKSSRGAVRCSRWLYGPSNAPPANAERSRQYRTSIHARSGARAQSQDRAPTFAIAAIVDMELGASKL